MPRLLRLLLCLVVHLFRSRRDLLLENLALRQQLWALKWKNPKPRLRHFDRLFWVTIRRTWPKWKEAVMIVTPETVVSWHRAGFRLYWQWRSRHQKTVGRRRIRKELRDSIFRMVAENPTWGAPRINGELLKLGFDVSERTVSRWVQRAPKKPGPAEPIPILEYRMTSRRLAPGERADGVVVFERPAFKESTERLELQLARADQVDRPILLPVRDGKTELG